MRLRHEVCALTRTLLNNWSIAVIWSFQ